LNSRSQDEESQALQFFKKNFEKIALALFVMAMVIIGILLYRGVDRLESEIAGQAGVSLKPTGKNLCVLDAQDFDAVQRLEQPRVKWDDPDTDVPGTLVKPTGFVWCANAECWHWIPATATKCPFCGALQGDDDTNTTSEDEDADGDTIPDEYEEQYVFLDPSNPLDAAEDADNDHFSNYAEFRAGTSPDDPSSHPLLVTRLFLVSVQRDPFNARLQKVTAIQNRPKEEWDIQIDIFTDGDKRTNFTGLGKSITVNGIEYEITEVEKVIEERFSPTTNSKVNIDQSTVLLKPKQGDPIKLVRGQPAYDKEDTVRFVLVLDPENRRRWRPYSASSDQALVLTDGQENSERYSIQVQNPSLVVLRPLGEPQGNAYPITKLSRTRLQKLIESQRPKRVGQSTMDMRGASPEMYAPRTR
jgi:hypothetical protein